MNVLFASGREPAYIRNRLVLQALRESATVVECTSSVRNTAARMLEVAARLAAHPACDAAWIGFWGHPLMLVPGRFRRRPVLFDAYLSVFNTACDDRRWFAPGSPPGRLARWLDRHACANANLVIVDTKAHAQYFATTLGIPVDKLRVLYVGCDETLFSPQTSAEPPDGVFTYGSFQPLHGMDVVAAAADVLGPAARITIGGAGAGSAALAANYPALAASGWIPFADLPRHIGAAAICLGGPFGRGSKAQMVVPTKTFQFMAMGKAIIASDTPANREVLADGVSAMLVPPADPPALAGAIQRLLSDPVLRQNLGNHAREAYLAHYTNTHRAAQIKSLISEVI